MGKNSGHFMSCLSMHPTNPCVLDRASAYGPDLTGETPSRGRVAAGLRETRFTPTALAHSIPTRYPIIAHSHLCWDWVWQHPQQFLSRLSRSHRVLFVETRPPTRTWCLPWPVGRGHNARGLVPLRLAGSPSRHPARHSGARSLRLSYPQSPGLDRQPPLP